MRRINCIGVMSGTSLDGMDIVACTITQSESYSFVLNHGKTYKYSAVWEEKLTQADTLVAPELIRLDRDYGDLIGQFCNEFCEEFEIDKSKIEFIASHGHTVFHQPEKNFTLQIGAGANIAAKTHIQTICDFRSRDVAEGGQGAPLVPIGDELLFKDYEYCLNLGGFANISFQSKGDRIAFDICPLNIPLNRLSNKLGQPYDDAGNIAKSGQVIRELLAKLNALEFYEISKQKSLGKEWLDQVFWPIIENEKRPVADLMATIVEHYAVKISDVLNENAFADKSKLLVTGGGAYNTYMLERLAHYTDLDIVIPQKDIVEFKEAILFGLLGFLRIYGDVNALSTVTGARINSVGGAIYHN